ncbi:hypothetical protein DYB30_009293 [Aphanomyces astaci]|uniref:Peptidase S54 rhomboid domain-containing protein n=1 Tax=Aphanomyces astaci TaxID=112090 RepID=A0A397E5M0_APHAT|nr:hypothetical protein DYB30_009293 [Aphanomyces astaci]RHY90352.1 hypothetical protein DYB26_004281 [Aphanomyces astaci]
MFGRRPFANMPRHPRGRGQRNDGMLLMLAMQLLGQIQQLERKPPVTLALMGNDYHCQSWLCIETVGTLRCPDLIVEQFEWPRLIVSAFLHADEWHFFIHQCSIGFSAVLFALKVVLNQSSPAYTNILGIQVHTKYAAWVELAYLHYFVPGSSFVGHLAGICAGNSMLL